MSAADMATNKIAAIKGSLIGPDAGAKLGTRFFHIPLLILMSTLFVLFPTVGVAFFLEYLPLTWLAENILVARKYKSQTRGFPTDIIRTFNPTAPHEIFQPHEVPSYTAIQNLCYKDKVWPSIIFTYALHANNI